MLVPDGFIARRHCNVGVVVLVLPDAIIFVVAWSKVVFNYDSGCGAKWL